MYARGLFSYLCRVVCVLTIMTPLFSIITVTYNASGTLGATMASVAEQTCDLYEHIIQDGASKDNTLEIAARGDKERTKIFSSPDSGIYDAMNKAMAEAKGDYVIFLNAGDRFHSPETLQHLADAIMDNDYPGIVYGQTDIVDKNGKRIAGRHLRAPEELTLQSFAEGMVVCHQAFVALRRITGLYSAEYRFSADYEWCIHCLQHSHRNVYVDEVTIDYLNEGVTTANRRKSLIERYKIMCRYYGRMATMRRHLRFLVRFMRRRSMEKKLARQ